jgi:hypothetical protein
MSMPPRRAAAARAGMSMVRRVIGSMLLKGRLGVGVVVTST